MDPGQILWSDPYPPHFNYKFVRIFVVFVNIGPNGAKIAKRDSYSFFRYKPNFMIKR